MFNENHTLGISSSGNKYLKEYFPYFLIVLIVGVTRFLMLNNFGLYEDDWAFSGNAITNSFTQNLSGVVNVFKTFWQGRPLHMTFILGLASLGGYLGSLKALYVIGFLILCLNALLFYSLLKKVFKETSISLIITLFFCVYPADTTFSYLQHLFGLQTSLFLILISFHFYLSSYRNISYFFASLSLLTYESVFLVFAAAPFLSTTRSNRRANLVHFFKMLFIITVYAIFRKLSKEQRVEEVNIISTLGAVVKQVSIGPLISFSTFFDRPGRILSSANLFDIVIIATASVILFFILLLIKESNEASWRQDLTQSKRKILDKYKRFMLTGYGMVLLAYPLVITLSIHETSGRASRVHFAAAFGASLVVGCLWTVFLRLSLDNKFWNKLILFLLSFHIVSLAFFCINVQYFYKVSWDYQRAFWTDVLYLAPDIEDGTVILVNAPSLERYGKEINPFDWSMPSVLSSIYKFPTSWKNYPRLYLMNVYENNPNIWQKLISENSQLILSGQNKALTYYYAWEPDRVINSRDLILIEEINNHLVRRDSIKFGNTSVEFKPLEKVDNLLPDLPKSILFDELISYRYGLHDKSLVPIYFKPQE